MLRRRRHPTFGELGVVILLGCMAVSVLGAIGDSGAIPMPDPALTPGDVLPVTLAEICKPGYSSKVRNVPESVKRQVYRRYGIVTHKPGEYEIDHLVSLELGGSNAITNLWPERYTGPGNAHFKDKAEDATHRAACREEILLIDAQRQIATNWTQLYHRFVGLLP